MTNKQIISRSIFLLSLIGVAASVSGCAQDVGIIDRTRPGYVKQSTFMNDDEWYYAQTVVGSDFQDTPGATVGNTSPLKRIRWTVTEDTLFAYSTVEPSIGTSKGLRDPKDRRLGVVAAFPIRSHFDIQRGYNSSTGQVNNVISENSSDRLWYDREYMRVDWANNQITDFGFFDRALGRFSSLNRLVPEADSPSDYNRVRITDDIIDTVTEYYFEPNPENCYYAFGGAYQSCEAGPLSVRNFFWKVKSHNAESYEPLLYSDYVNLDNTGNPVGPQNDGSFNSNDRLRVANISNHFVECTPSVKQKYLGSADSSRIDLCQDATFDMFKRFGYFAVRRTAYTPRRGASPLSHQYQYAERWNIWQNSFKTNPDGSYVIKDNHKVAIPLSERKPKQIVYYLSPGFPENRPGIFNPKTYGSCGIKCSQDDGKECHPDDSAVCSLQESWNKVFTHTIALTRNREECSASTVAPYVSSNLDSLLISFMNFASLVKSGSNPSDITKFAQKYFDNLHNTFFGDQFEAGLKYLQGPSSDVQKLRESFIQAANRKYTQLLGTAPPSQLKINDFSYGNVFTKLVKQFVALAGETDKSSPAARTAMRKYLAYASIIEQIASFGVTEYVKGGGDFSTVCGDASGSNKGLSEEIKKFITQNISCNDSIFARSADCNDYKNSMVDSSAHFDIDNEQTKNDIRASNNSSDHMFVIKPNSCSWSQLKDWFNKHADLNSEVQSLYAENKDRLDASKANALPVEELLKLCAKLEWYTKDESDPKDRFDWQRFGDLRYSFVNWVYEDTGGWFGLGPVFADPVTGEIISGAANFSGHTLDNYAAYSADLNMYTNGTITDDDIISGRYINDDRDALKNLGSNNDASYLRAPTSLNQKSTIFGSDNYDKTYNALTQATPSSSKLNLQQIRKKLDDAINKYGSYGGLMANYLQFHRLAENKAQTKAEKIVNFMSRPENLSAMMKDENFSQLYDSLKTSFSAGPGADSSQLTPEKQKDFYHTLFSPIYSARRQQALARKYRMMNMFTDEALKESLLSKPELIGSAQFFKKQGWTRKQIEDYLAKHLFLGTELHELGHTMGLRHNFAGSSDALNYPAEYWDVRAALRKDVKILGQLDNNNKQKIESGLDLMDINDFEKKVYPIKDKEHKPKYFSQGEYRNSSIMDYGGSPNADFAGLGSYDDAAIQFAYAKKIQVFDGNASLNIDSLFRLLLQLHAFDYRDLPNVFSRGKYELADSYVDEKDGVDKMVRGRRWIDVSQAQKEYVQRVKENTKSYLSSSSSTSFDGKSDNTVPYAFCSDLLNFSLPFCETFDYGATYRESLNEKIDSYLALETFVRYRKDLWHDSLNYYFGKLSSVLSQVQAPFVHYTWNKRLGFDDILDMGKDPLAAAVDGINFMALLIARPEPGAYCASTNSTKTVFNLINGKIPFGVTGVTDLASCADSITISRKDGVPFSNLGSSNTYLPTLDRVAGYFDKFLAIQSFFFVQGYDIRSIFNTDITARNYSFWTEFEGSVYNLLHDLLLGNDGVYEGVINDNNQYEPPELVSPECVADPSAPSCNRQKGMPRVFNLAAYQLGLIQNAIIFQILVNDTPYDAENDAIQYMKVCVGNRECDNVCDATDPTDPNKKVWDGPNCKTFVHPDVPQIYRAPIAKDGRSITGDIIDHLNDIKSVYVNAQEKLKKNPADPDAKQGFRVAQSEMQYYISILDFIRSIMTQTRGLY